MAPDGVGGQRHAPPALPPEKYPVPIVYETGWAPRPVWTGAENLDPPSGFDPRTVQPVKNNWYGTELYKGPRQGFTNPGCQVAVWVRSMLLPRVTLLAPMILTWIPDF